MIYLYPLIVSILWAINYVILEKIYQKKNYLIALFVMWLFQLIFFWVFAFLNWWNLVKDFSLIFEQSVSLIFWGCIITFIVANILLNLALSKSNSTLVSLIEICYPLFIIITTYFFFWEHHLSRSVVIWWLLVMLWVWLVIRWEHENTKNT